MKHGDFTALAELYVNRPGYSGVLLNCLKNHIFNKARAWTHNAHITF